MRFRIATIFVCLCLLHGAPSFSQTAAPAAPQAPGRATPPPPPPAPTSTAPSTAPRVDLEAGGQPVNIQVEVSVIDQTAAGSAQPKTLTVLLADRAFSRIRSSFEQESINVDARPTIIDGHIRLSLTIQINPMQAAKVMLQGMHSLSVLLESGKSLVALESGDPSTNQKTRVEVKATIQK